MRQLHLVRHGPTHARAMVGWTDLPADLSDTAALARLSAQLPAEAEVISSDLSRAITTADAIQGDRPRLPHDAALRELHFGDWEMRSAAEIEASHPELSRAYWDHPGSVRPPNGESWSDASQRISRAIDTLLDRTPARPLIVVAHFGAILTQLQRALSVSAEDVLAHRIDNLSVTSLTWHAGGWQVEAINHIP